ncbi:ShlB/FhaC/HecB family hemolysin secretion/activation protein [Waterburya agarophytonicola K14]|uniref:ShlB/FhaC/HecB family hemolysin secretion/activation protein n=1 Tax=Waterburya agarophytonicola KI4 TaxID=2874699 RepID=A0A964FF30_9CYAN|nr:ShlB/FhaC/HecB family hemolysin secretion/activation protein [Waterburya agarophytonicola]MCC0177310.1 ShlB/FhaC/HecB family hemolysin secretion/activation protein [Waterburya agarophytonicola KI4]
MFVPNTFWQQLSSNQFFKVNINYNSLSFLSIYLLALIASCGELQPLNAAEVSPPQKKANLLTQSPGDGTIAQDSNSNDVPEQIVVKSFDIVGSSVFSDRELDKAIESYRDRPLTLPELFQARSIITKLYTDKGYVNSGAYIPPQELDNGTVKIAVLEGKLEGINVSGTERLTPKYISSRIEAAAGKPVNIESLLAALQLLRLDPLINNVSAELSAGIEPGTSLLDIQIEEADVFSISTSFNNKKSPSVGSNQRSASFNHGNLLGIGDRFDFNFSNTEGSNSFDFGYSLPFNSKNGTIKAAYGTNSNDVVEDPFTPIDLESQSRYFELNLRQPLVLKPNQEFAMGISFSRSESETFLQNDGFFLSRGANEDGETRISAVRLLQEYVNRDDKKVLAFRSQFSLGIDAFNATINDGDVPDSTFFAWRGQGQWVRRLDEDFLFLLRGDVQVAGGSLVPLEQFRVGGVNSARGYRQDLSLGDSGAFASAELQIPVLRFKKIDGLVQIAPFFDIGTLWNTDEVEIANATLPSLGLGLNFAMGTRFNARLDWGIPLVDVETTRDSLQENGVHFAVDYSFF